jgi:hypothetical protein
LQSEHVVPKYKHVQKRPQVLLHAKVAQKAVSRYPNTMPQKQPLQITNKAVPGGHCCDVVMREDLW